MSKMNLLLIFLSFVIMPSLIFEGNLHAQDYYIDFLNGSDSDSGTETGNPFMHCPGDANATGVAATTELVGGDKVIFKGGTDYKGMIELKWSGADSDNRIIYDGNSSGTWGTGRAIINNENDLLLNKGFYTSGTVGVSYITINNFEFVDIGGYPTWPPSGYDCSTNTLPARPGRGVTFYNSSSGVDHITVSNNYFHEMGEWHNAVPSNNGTISGVGVQFRHASNVVIDNNEFTRMKIGIHAHAFAGGTIGPITISNNNIHDYIVWGIDIGPSDSYATIGPVTITGNSIHDIYQYSFGVSGVTTEKWAGCAGTQPHVDGIFYRGTTASWTNVNWDGLILANNKFYNSGTAPTGPQTASLYAELAGGVIKVYNNLFYYVSSANPLITLSPGPTPNSTPSDYYVYNNSFIGNSKALGAGASARYPIAQVRIMNNVMSRNNNLELMSHSGVAYINTFYSDNNIVMNGNDDVTVKWNGSFYTLAEYVSITGYDTNSLQQDPLFVAPSPNSLALSINSLAIDTGADLGAQYNKDILNNYRPYNLYWDMGAYEYNGSASIIRPSAPTNLTISK